MSAVNNKFVLPSDYTFTPGGLLVHKDTYERVNKLLEQARNRDPELHDMYIYNDFFGYALFELVDNTLSSIHSFVTKKKWMDAWNAILALVLFNSMIGGDWTQVDDGDRVIATENVFGALLVTTIRALESAEPPIFNEDAIPNLESALMSIAGWGEGSCNMEYTKVIRGYGKKLFGARTPEERTALRETRKESYEAFVKGMSERERKKRGDKVPGGSDDDEGGEDEDDDGEENDEDQEPWFGNAKAKDAGINNASFRMTAAWKSYKDIWSSSPHHPMRGPKNWDITKWSDADKKRFSYDHIGGELSDDDFMF